MTDPNAPRPTVSVCRSCRGSNPDLPPEQRPGVVLSQGLCAVEPGDVAVQVVDCLGNCNRGPSVALQCAGRWQYLFGEIDPVTGPADLLAAARLLAVSTDGLLPWRERPPALKKGLIARLPPLQSP
ncbi:DUF1636 family protein [Niveispirillum sp. KHB5.9]|uniref:DUF1636 family protein n=1 Tax=Niveispirillum sp. KHB5.9 TaxID=3400269 RepID=UPI003A8BFB88